MFFYEEFNFYCDPKSLIDYHELSCNSHCHNLTLKVEEKWTFEERTKNLLTFPDNCSFVYRLCKKCVK